MAELTLPCLFFEGVAIVDDIEDDSDFDDSDWTEEDPLWDRRHSVLRRRGDEELAQEHSLSPALTSLSDVPTRPLVWLWGNVLAQGKISLLTGAAGMGKSFVALDMVAAITRPNSVPLASTPEARRADSSQHGVTPDIDVEESVDPLSADSGVPGPSESSTCEPSAAADVLVFCPEHELANVVRPRLQAANADITRVHTVRGLQRTGRADCREFRLNDDLQMLERELAKRSTEGNPVRLIVIDPFRIELFSDRTAISRTREVIRNLTEFAASADVAILLVTESDSNARGRFAKSDKALESSIQSVWTIVPDLDRAERKLLLSIKSNWTDNTCGRAFHLRQGAVHWESGSCQLTADQYLREQKSRSKDKEMWEHEWTELGRAKQYLQRLLAGGIAMPLYDVKLKSSANDISFSTLRRAFCGLRGKSERIGLSRSWIWSLPESSPTEAYLPDKFEWPFPKQ